MRGRWGVLALAVALALAACGPIGTTTATSPTTSPTPKAKAKAPFYVDQGSPAYLAWQQADGPKKALLARIALTPTAYWITTSDPQAAVAEAEAYLSAATDAGSPGLLALYAMPDRDCGGWSSGGTSVKGYPEWVRAVSEVIEPGTWVVLEPDALAMVDECPGGDERLALLGHAAADLTDAGARVYVDAGNAKWLEPEVVADRLRAVGVGNGIWGFALNVSNFVDTDESLAYGRKVVGILGGGHFIVDTSRNGRGWDGTWCNPPGRGLGASPQLLDDPAADALVWVKRAGESDGECNGGPAAGQWWPKQALEMSANANLTGRWAFTEPTGG